MKLRIVLSSVLLMWPAALVAQLSVPVIGIARYADHTVRGVNGLEANLLIDHDSLSSADAVSFSDAGGLVSVAETIQLVTLQGVTVAQFRSNEASPVLNIDGALTTAIAWLPSRSALLYWNGASFAECQVAGAIPGAVTSVQLSGAGAAALLSSDANGNVFQSSVSLQTGNILSVDMLASVKGPAFQHAGFIISESGDGLAIRASDGSVRTLPLSAPNLVFERMSSEWVHIASPSTHQDWALHLTSKALQLSILPAPTETGGSQMRHANGVQK
jgi:hypothetical protein